MKSPALLATVAVVALNSCAPDVSNNIVADKVSRLIQPGRPELRTAENYYNTRHDLTSGQRDALISANARMLGTVRELNDGELSVSDFIRFIVGQGHHVINHDNTKVRFTPSLNQHTSFMKVVASTDQEWTLLTSQNITDSNFLFQNPEFQSASMKDGTMTVTIRGDLVEARSSNKDDVAARVEGQDIPLGSSVLTITGELFLGKEEKPSLGNTEPLVQK